MRTDSVASRNNPTAFAGNRGAIYPLLAAWYSVLGLAAAHLSASGHVQMVRPALLFATIVGLLAWLLSGLTTRDPDRRTILSVLAVAWFAGFGIMAGPLLELGASRGLALVLSITLLVAFAGMVHRLRWGVKHLARMVRATVVILIAFPMFSFVSVQVQNQGHGRDLQGGNETVAAPVPGAPSIFLIVLDKYTGSRSLQENYGFDNTAFQDSLRRRGFVVPRAARSNYPHTWMTLASMLNWDFLDRVFDGMPANGDHVRAVVEDSRTVRFLKDRGYEFVFLPTTFHATASNELADRQVPAPTRRGTNITAAWILSSAAYGLPRALGGRGWSPAVFPYPIESAAQLEEKFELLAELAAEPGVRFVFAHLLVPHEPYVFHEDCTHRDPLWPPTDYVPDQTPIREAYIAQVRCLNSKLERLVDRILAAAEVPPVILLQADHGHGMMAVDPLRGDQLPLDELDPAQVRERTDIFAAYYLPDGGRSAIYDSITPVNVLPSVLNHYLDARIPLKADAVYWGRLHPPFELTRLR